MRLRHLVASLVLVLLAALPSAAQTRTVTAAWDANTDAYTRGYMLAYGTEPGIYQWTVDAGPATSVQVTLNLGAVYYFTVRAYDANGFSGPGSAEAVIDLTAGVPAAQFTAVLQGTDTALVTWSLVNVVSATINGVPVGASGSATVAIAGPTTFTLVALGANGQTLTRTATVSPVAVAPTARISATLQSPGLALVTWSTTNAVSAAINGVAVATSGSASVPINGTTTFRLVATGANGAMADAFSTVVVQAEGLSARITATPAAGNTALVTWSTTGASRAWINGAPVGLSGSSTLPAAGVTSYRLLAEGANGAMVDAYAYVGVPQAALSASIAATAIDGQTALVSWSTTGAVSASIDGVETALSGTARRSITGSRYRLLATAPGGAMIDAFAAIANVPPAPPAALQATVDGQHVTLSWRPGAGGGASASYLAFVGTAPGGSDVANGLALGDATTVSAELPRGRYYVRLRAMNAYGASATSNEVALFAGTQLLAPANLMVRWVGATAVLSWVKPTGPAGALPTAYDIEAGSAPGLANLAVVRLGDVSTVSFPVPPGSYYVRLRGVSDTGESAATPDLFLSPPQIELPGVPRNLRSTKLGGAVTLHWSAPVGGGAVSGYVVEAGTSPGASDIGAVQVGTATTFAVPMAPGSYYVRIRAMNASGAGQPSNELVVRQ